MSSGEPPKFIKNAQGIRSLNPQYKIWKQQQGTAPSSSPAAQQEPAIPQQKNDVASLAVVSNMQQMSQLDGAQATKGYEQAMNHYTQVAQTIGLTAQNAQDEVSKVFAKLEIPSGLMNKMYLLNPMAEIHYLNDDSGSMRAKTDSFKPNGQAYTRLEEMQLQQERILELLAYFITPQQVIRIIWMNNPNVTTIQKMQGEPPSVFYQRALGELRHAYARMHTGRTPAMALFQKSFQISAGRPTAMYLFCDGCPTDATPDDLVKLIRNRPNPQQFPVTFVACTNQDEDVEWFGEVDSVSQYTGASDDFGDQSRTVLAQQGQAMPFSYGLYLMALVCGALDPDCLDSLDESFPMTKNNMSEILGYTMSDQEYDYYFQEFLKAQRLKRATTKEDNVAKNYISKWNREEFRNAVSARDIPTLQQYRKDMRSASSDSCVIA